MFNPAKVSQEIKDEFISYITTSFHPANSSYAEQLKSELEEEGAIAKGPYLDVTSSFKQGKNLIQLIEDGSASIEFYNLEKDIPDKQKKISLTRPLYKHQENSFLKINSNENVVVTTGTGSGKTECFLLPIINYLLEEKRNGTLSSGVRAILIYPMNALANDQMKRLRDILAGYPDITFGVYNGDTANKQEDGVKKYHDIFKEKPLLKNELVSRDVMRATPPNILVTNYSMLEYMLLRPNDDLVFSGAQLKFIVLDEAHIYKGATGIETSLLLRRLKARITDPENVIHILTSATLGGKEADNDIISFAENLCDSKFTSENIIRSDVIVPNYINEPNDYPNELFAELANPVEPLNTILNKYGVKFDENCPDAEIIYDLCESSRSYRLIRETLTYPMTMDELESKVRKVLNITKDDIVNLISVASKAEKNGTALIKARYHMFIRAMEGAYITLNKDSRLTTKRKCEEIINEQPYRYFEAVVCDNCGRIGITGKTTTDIMEFSSNRFDPDYSVYLPTYGNEIFDLEYDDESEEEYGDIHPFDYVICSVCGEIHHISELEEFKCGHGSEFWVKLRKADKRSLHNEYKCPICCQGRMKNFYLGYDAATTVIATELFDQLPEKEAKLESKTLKADPNNQFAAFMMKPKADIVRKAKQFLAFSDSRSEAAYFASRMSQDHMIFLRKRGIWHVLNEVNDLFINDCCPVKDFLSALSTYFCDNKTFADENYTGKENLMPESKKQALIAILYEMINARKNTSLVSLGILNFEYLGLNENLITGLSQQYNIDVKSMESLLNLLALDIIYTGAVKSNDQMLTDDDKEFLYFTKSGQYFVLVNETSSSESKFSKNLHGWIPKQKENGRRAKNNRVGLITKILDISENDAVTLLEQYWEYLDKYSEYPLSKDSYGYYFEPRNFVIRKGNANTPVYICDTCGKVTMFNCNGLCPITKCDGHLKEVSHEDIIENNHYAKLFSSNNMKPLHIKEHTAQLGRKEALNYQKMFLDKQINALSCSTTFEMGVDVGDLETVYLRDMPPSPANYVQRAGRAGRSLDSAAFALTYAKLSSHDFTYFNAPEKMISGKISVPMFSLSNEKITLRHIFAVVLSDFFKKNDDVYNGNNADIFLNCDGYDRLVNYIKDKPDDLKDILKKSIPAYMHEPMGINDFSWIDKMVGTDGVLSTAVEDYRNTIKEYSAAIEQAKASDNLTKAGNLVFALKKFRKAKDDGFGKNLLIEFLARNNVLPRYGFPVDVVELFSPIDAGFSSKEDKKVEMVRDLQLAVAEYAPGSQIIADNKLYTSRYIRKLPKATGQSWDDIYIAQCENKSCETWNRRIIEPSINGERCISCGRIIPKSKWKKAIEPRRGFIAEQEVRNVPRDKPDKMYRSDDFYIGDSKGKTMFKKTFLVNNKFKLKLESSKDDSLMVVCNSEFMVCPRCGYSKSLASYNSKDSNHRMPNGDICKTSLSRRSLCHTFKTDVVQLTFGISYASSTNVMLSVMYALLEAISNILDIERTDIKGCLHKVYFENRFINEIVLYDAVPGGAGHVRRLATNDGIILQNVINEAIRITKSCSCETSCYNCLRNYYNQVVHDKLNRYMAFDFLEKFSGTMTQSSENLDKKKVEKISDELNENQIVFSDDYIDCSDYDTWNDLKGYMPESGQDEIDKFVKFDIELPSAISVECTVKDTDISQDALMVWKNDKILIFDNDTVPLKINGWTSLKLEEINYLELQNKIRRK